MTNMRLVLIGYRGTGKTSVAKILAERFSAKLISMDDLIVKKAGMSIPEIVEKHGWERFRDVESEVIKEISNDDDCVIDAGGGVVLKDENIKRLKKNGKIVLLKADVKTIAERIRDDTERPSLTGNKSSVEEIEGVLEERKDKYDKAADFVVDTSNLSIEQVAEKIVGCLKK